MDGTVDFGQHAERGTIEKYLAGTYKVTLNRWENCIARTGMEQVRYYATIAEGEHQDKPIVDHIAMSEAAGWRVAWFIKEALNFSKDDMKALGKVKLGSAKFNKLFDLAKGRTMYWVVAVDPIYNNNKVMEYVPDPDGEAVSVDETEDLPDFLKKND